MNSQDYHALITEMVDDIENDWNGETVSSGVTLTADVDIESLESAVELAYNARVQQRYGTLWTGKPWDLN